MISRLIALSTKLDRKIDMQTALTIPLSPVPLCLAHLDGNRRVTGKSVLSHILLEQYFKKTSYSVKQEVLAYIVDFIHVPVSSS